MTRFVKNKYINEYSKYYEPLSLFIDDIRNNIIEYLFGSEDVWKNKVKQEFGYLLFDTNLKGSFVLWRDYYDYVNFMTNAKANYTYKYMGTEEYIDFCNEFKTPCLKNIDDRLECYNINNIMNSNFAKNYIKVAQEINNIYYKRGDIIGLNNYIHIIDIVDNNIIFVKYGRSRSFENPIKIPVYVTENFEFPINYYQKDVVSKHENHF